jgi:hypothetical protein
MNNFKIIWKIIITAFLPTLAALFTYLAKSNCFLENVLAPFGSVINVNSLKDNLLLFAIIIQFLLALQIVFIQFHKDKLSNQRDRAIEYHKKLFIKSLEKDLDMSGKDINVRIFLPHRFFKFKKTIEKILGNKVKFKKEFKIRNVNGLAEPGKTEKLRFIVEPEEKTQGLVGECYNTENIVFDNKLKTNNTNYNLDKNQLARTSDLTFCLCVPLFDQKGANVIAIVSFDCRQKINNIEKKQAIWQEHVLNYSHTLYDNFRYLFY